MHSDDMDLVREFAVSNSEAAFATVVRRHVNLVYSAALRRLGNAAEAEEVAQIVFLILAKKAPSLRRGTVLSGWLYQTAQLTAANHQRAAVRRRQREQEAFMQFTEQSEPDASWHRLSPLLEEAIARLGQKDRSAIVLRFFENRTVREVAAALGLREDAAQKRVNRATHKLREYFVRRGVQVSTTTLLAAIGSHAVQAAPAHLALKIAAGAALKGTLGAASTSTLKTTLNIMAWTKAKTGVVTGTVIAVAAISAVSMMSCIHHLPPGRTSGMKLPTGNVKPSIAYSYSGCVFVLASDGSLWSWGDERLGWPVLGYTNVQNTVSLRHIGNENDWRSLAVGDSQCLAIKLDGTLWAWGENLNYQLGDGTEITRPTPVPSIPGNDWRQAASGGSASFALKNDGTLWAWGNNWSGQLGSGNTNSTINAVEIGTSTNWTKVWADGVQTVGLQSDGSLWFWGSLSGGSEKDKTFAVPTRISSDTNWTDVCFGYFTMFALKSDGTLWTWGLKADIYNGGPDNGLDGSLARITPTQIGSEDDWASFSSSPGCFYLLLRKKDGSLWELDASEHRAVKSPNSYKPIVQREINFKRDIAAYSAGGDNMGFVLTPDGEVWTWGRVLGEHAPKDFWDQNDRRPLHPKYNNLNKPWRVSISESQD